MLLPAFLSRESWCWAAPTEHPRNCFEDVSYMDYGCADFFWEYSPELNTPRNNPHTHNPCNSHASSSFANALLERLNINFPWQERRQQHGCSGRISFWAQACGWKYLELILRMRFVDRHFGMFKTDALLAMFVRIVSNMSSTYRNRYT